jgi:hypothetical protein
MTHDEALAYHMLVPDDYDGGNFIHPELGSNQFNLTDADGNVDGPFDPNDFISDEDGVTYAQTEGRGVFLRVVHQEGNHLWSLDGAGKLWKYTMAAAPPILDLS